MIQTDRLIEHRTPHIVVVEERSGKCTVSDIALPGDHNVQEKNSKRRHSMKI